MMAMTTDPSGVPGLLVSAGLLLTALVCFWSGHYLGRSSARMFMRAIGDWAGRPVEPEAPPRKPPPDEDDDQEKTE